MESQVQNFYAGQTVLLTGATGFLGKILLEKLLRSCPKIEKIYVVIRSKNEKNPESRFEEIFECPIFKNLKTSNPSILKKVHLLVGDAQAPNFGFNQETTQLIKNKINIVINNASLVNYDAKFKDAIKTNVFGVQSLLNLAKGMKNLKAFLQLSTVYSNFPRPEIQELIYESPMELERLLDLTESMEEIQLEEIKNKLLGKWPNTVVFTKAAAEALVKREGRRLPICLIRPSIVLSTFKEPLEGWNESISAASRMTLAYLTGVFHVPYVNKTVAADLMPADYVVNAIIAAAWGTHNKNEVLKDNVELYQTSMNEKIFEEVKEKSDIPVFNVVSSTLNVITWGDFWEYLRTMSDSFPLNSMVWFQYIRVTQSMMCYCFYMYILQYPSAYILDFFMSALGKPRKFVDMVKDANKMSILMRPFTTKEFTIINLNTQNLWNNMNAKDKEIFYFDILRLNWFNFLKVHCAGCREYLAKETLDNMAQAVNRHRILRNVNLITTIILSYFVVRLIMDFIGISFRL